MVRQKRKAKGVHPPSLEELPPLMSVSEAGKALGLTRQGMWNAINRGYVETVKSGPYTLVPRHAVERYAVRDRKRGRRPKAKQEK